MENKTIYDLMHRRSCRAFKPEPVAQEAIETIVQCGLFAPSAMNQQPWHLTVIRDKAILDDMSIAMAEIMAQSGDEKAITRAKDPGFHSFHNAPCAIMLSGPETAKFRVSDCGGAAVQLTVAAQALGVGSVIVASVLPVFQSASANRFIERLQIPAGYIPTLSIALGYPACDEPEAPPRKADTVTYIG